MDKLLPPNPYWPGRVRNGMRVLLVISVLVFIFAVLTITALGYAGTRPYDSHPPVRNYRNTKSSRSIEYSSGISWNEGANNIAAEIFVRMSTIFVELFHLPISFILYRRGGHHPVAALVMAILLFGGWVNITWLRTLDFLALEVSVTDTWLGLSYSSVAVGSFISLTYTVYLGYAAAAVHKWRRVQKEAKYVTKGGEFES